jgi:Response regulators consisting of a CheY-like receiver domain and a winged-helix DNA-binding domain
MTAERSLGVVINTELMANTPDDTRELLPADVLSTRSVTVGVLEDEKYVRDIICRFLLAERMEPRDLQNGAAAHNAALKRNIDLLLIDLGLGAEDGIDIIRRVRAVSTVSIIVVSGRADISSVAGGLDAGADDFVRKPIAFEELGARIRSVLRRRVALPPAEMAAAAVTIGKVRFALADNEVVGPEGRVRLTEREVLILSHLLRNRGNPVSRELLSRALQGHGWDPTNRTLDVHIANIRAKLVSAGGVATMVRTRRNLGYQLPLASEED